MLAFFIGVAATAAVVGAAATAAAAIGFFTQAGQPLTQEVDQCNEYTAAYNQFLPHKPSAN